MRFSDFLTHLRRFGRNKDGVSAVEFALILPVMAMLYFGSIEVSFMMSVDRKVTQTASSLGDLVARGTTISSTELDDIFAASSALFEPYDGSKALMRVTSIKMDKGKTEVVWSRAQNMSPYSKGSAVTVPDGLLSDGDGIVKAEVSYTYNSILGYFLPSAQNLNEVFYLRPRRVDIVDIE